MMTASSNSNPLGIDFTRREPNVHGVPLWMLPSALDADTTAALVDRHARGRAFSYLSDFCLRHTPFVPALHHRLICDHVDGLMDDEFDVLVVMSPPASAKSSYISVAAPAYIVGRDPTTRIISVSRSAEMATEFGGRVKAIVESPLFMADTGVTLDQSSRAKDNWKTMEGGGYFAVGTGGGVLGRRADVVIADDIHASFEDAQSLTQLEKIHNWFESDLLSRLTPTGKLIVIGQRLNANDIIGYVLRRASENPDIRIRVLKLTAIATPDVSPDNPDLLGRTTPGERMWPEFYTDAYLRDRQRDDYIWRTLWMQEPPSDTGTWAAPSDITLIAPDDPSLTTLATAPHYLLTDLALSVNSGDYSVHLVVAVSATHDVTVVDGWRERAAVDTTARRHLALARQYKPVESLIDDDNAAKVYMQLLSSLSREQGIPVPMRMMPMRGQDKETRAAPLRGHIRRGKVRMVDAPWTRWLLNEIAQFPNASGAGVDDGVDALGLIGRRLASLATAAPAAAPATPIDPRGSFYSATLDELHENRRQHNHAKRF